MLSWWLIGHHNNTRLVNIRILKQEVQGIEPPPSAPNCDTVFVHKRHLQYFGTHSLIADVDPADLPVNAFAPRTSFPDQVCHVHPMTCRCILRPPYCHRITCSCQCPNDQLPFEKRVLCRLQTQWIFLDGSKPVGFTIQPSSVMPSTVVT